MRNPEFTKDIAAVVIDEAHCVSDWGDKFRKKFGELYKLRSFVPLSVPFLATSATLPPHILSDVYHKLGLSRHGTFVLNLGNDRPNITPLVCHMRAAAGDLDALNFAIREAYSGGTLVPTVIFFNTRELAYKGYRHLKALLSDHHKDKIQFLHAMRSAPDKAEIMGKFRNGEIAILCATEAAGLVSDYALLKSKLTVL